MLSQNEKYFDWASTIEDAHDALQATAGNATRFNKFLTVAEGPLKRIDVVLLWLF